MASTTASARLQYLHNASHALLISSPAVSAHLQSIGSDGTDQLAELSLRAVDASVCNACGNILIDGWSCHRMTQTKMEWKRRQETRNAAEKHRNTRPYELSCTRCHATTVVRPRTPLEVRPNKLSLKDPNSRTVATLVETSPLVASVSKPIAAKVSGSATSSSSRKLRSKQSSLQALLAGQKRPPPASTVNAGLSLVDFMKT